MYVFATCDIIAFHKYDKWYNFRYNFYISIGRVVIDIWNIKILNLK